MSLCCHVEGFDPTVVHLRGELDVATAASLGERLAEVQGDVEVDCSRLDFIDAAGLSVFVAAHLRCQERGVRFVLVELSASLRWLLQITELDGVFETHEGRSSHGIE
jgi:anti-anti-sigma factor